MCPHDYEYFLLHGDTEYTFVHYTNYYYYILEEDSDYNWTRRELNNFAWKHSFYFEFAGKTIKSLLRQVIEIINKNKITEGCLMSSRRMLMNRFTEKACLLPWNGIN